MKKILSYIFLIIFGHFYAQVADLASMANGEFTYFTYIKDNNEQIQGYLALYLKGEASKQYNNYEIIILDNNLNLVLSKDIEAEKLVQYYTPTLNKGKIILQPEYDLSKISLFKTDEHTVSVFGLGKQVTPEFREIDLQSGEIKTIEETDYFKINGSVKKMANGILGLYTSAHVFLDDKNHIYYYNEKKGKSFLCLENKNKEGWKKEISNLSNRKDKDTFKFIDSDEEYIYAILFKKRNKKYKEVKYLKIDIATGDFIDEIDITHLFPDSKIKFMMMETRLVDDNKIISIFKITDKRFRNLGFKGIVFNKKTKEIADNDIYFSDLKEYIDKVDAYGNVEGGMYLRIKDLFILKDGTTSLLFEKFRPKGRYVKMKTTDMVLLNTDNRFKLKDIEVLRKDKSKKQFTDYLFSQMSKDRSKAFFFYKDYVRNIDGSKEKNWKLFINQITKDGFIQDEMKISSKDDGYFIIPYIAKEGYILLREFNEKDKYNSIRLEKLNF